MEPSEPAIEVQGLRKRYGAVEAVRGVDLAIARGEVYALLGPNGAGKTTTVEILEGFRDRSGGEARVLGRDPASHDPALKARVGIVLQATGVHPYLTVEETIDLYRGYFPAPRPREEILELVGLLGEGDDRPATFSLGMKQRLGIGVTLVGRPELIILDEPANGLDPAGIREIRSLLRRLPETGTTVLVSSHQLAEVQAACDRLVVLDRGRLVTAGTTSDIVDARSEHAFDIAVDAVDLDRTVEILRLAGHDVAAGANELVVRPGADVRGRDLLRSLAEAGIFPDSLAPKTVSLEEAFLELTTAR